MVSPLCVYGKDRADTAIFHTLYIGVGRIFIDDIRVLKRTP